MTMYTTCKKLGQQVSFLQGDRPSSTCSVELLEMSTVTCHKRLAMDHKVLAWHELGCQAGTLSLPTSIEWPTGTWLAACQGPDMLLPMNLVKGCMQQEMEGMGWTDRRGWLLTCLKAHIALISAMVLLISCHPSPSGHSTRIGLIHGRKSMPSWESVQAADLDRPSEER